MDERELAAPCGIDCSQCKLYQALSDENLRQLIIQKMKMPPEKATCTGCRSIEGHCPVIGEQCATYVCAIEKGVDYCCDCADFPCQKLMPCAERADKLPHNIKIFSLTLRKQKGETEWKKAIAGIYKLYYSGQMVIGHGPQLRG
jgi:hypothetical protein